jgi:hypothetical protein
MNEFLEHILYPNQKDIVTCCFDLIFVYSGVQNVLCLLRDKVVKGFDWRNMCLYVLWNIWSVFVIYPDAGLYLALVVNTLYLITQLVWLALFSHYYRRI